MVLLIDADFLKYKGTDKDTVEELINKIDESIKSLLLYSKLNDFIIVTSKGPYLKKTMFQSYKENRPTQPKRVEFIGSYLKYKYNSLFISGFEADDICIHLKNKYPDAMMLCSQDKDVYNTVVGTHLIPYKKSSDGYSHQMFTASDVDVDKFFIKQMLMGDNCDNVKSLKGLGEKTADLLIESGIGLIEVLDIYKNGLNSIRNLDGFGDKEGLIEFNKNQFLLKPIGMSEVFLNDSIESLRDDGKINTIMYDNEFELPELEPFDF